MKTVMKAVMLEVPDHILEWRRKTGASRWDEVWDGVLHMAPEPSIGHQEVASLIVHWLLQHWSSGRSRRVLPSVNVSRPGVREWVKDYRVPDAVLLTDAAAAIEHVEHFEGGPDVVVEVRSPGDESYDKLPFYAAIGCREAWIVDRDTRACEIYAFDGGEVRRRGADAEGWTSSCVGVELRTDARRLAIRIAGEDGTRGLLP